jgi:lipoate---protein ligase
VADPLLDQGELTSHARRLAGLDLYAAAKAAHSVTPAAEVVVVVSRARDPGREIDLDRCRADRVPVVIRPTGGGAVVLAPGAVAASVVGPAGTKRSPTVQFRDHCQAVARALTGCGVEGVVVRGVSDLCLGDRKIAGSSLRIWRDMVLFQVAILVDMDLSLIERYLPMPSRQPDYRRHRPHRDFVVNLNDAGFHLSPNRVADALRHELTTASASMATTQDQPAPG